MRRASLFKSRPWLSIMKRGRNTAVNPSTPAPVTVARSFEEIPEAKGVPLLGTLLDYTPIRGFKVPYTFELWAKRHKEYGDIYKEKLPGAKDYTVFCRSPADTEIMFKSEGRMPLRQTLEAITFFKKVCNLPETFTNLNGEEWYKQRQVINSPLLKNKTVWKCVNEQHKVCKDFVKNIRRNIDDEGEVDDFQLSLNRWSFEISAAVVLQTRMGLLSEASNNSFLQIFQAMEMLNEFIGKSLFGIGLWKYIKTKERVDIEAISIESFQILGDLIEKKIEAGGLENSVLGQINGARNLSQEEKISVVSDLLGATDSAAKSTGLIIYCLTSNPKVQEKLRAEILELPKNIDGRVIETMKYMNAFIKETARLYPFVHVHLRAFDNEIVLSGYRIPAGIYVMNTANSTQNRNPKYFPKPDQFLPERWMDGREKSLQKYVLTGPFGMGARACPGRRFAMLQVRLLLIELLKNFKIEYHYKPIESVIRLTASPSEEPRFKFIPLDASK